LLLLMGLGAAGVKAQVRIGGNGAPNAAAALDLNADDATNTGTKTLALPRVSLASTTDLLGNASLLTGMLVYNTNTTLGVGVFFWDGSEWMVLSSIVTDNTDGVLGSVTGSNGTYRTWCFPESSGLGCWMLDNTKEGTPTYTTYSGQAVGARGYYYNTVQVLARTGKQFNACPNGWFIPSLGELLKLDSYLSEHGSSTFASLWLDPNTAAGVMAQSTWQGWGADAHVWSRTQYQYGTRSGWYMSIWLPSDIGITTVQDNSFAAAVRCMK